MRHFAAAVLFAALAVTRPDVAQAQANWDMPTPYPDSNFHEENIAAFIKEVNKNAGGAVTITLHPNQSLIKHPDIKNSVRDGIVPIGELLASRLENESPIFGADNIPFLADSYPEAMKLYQAQKPYMDKLLARQGLKLLFSVPWPPQGLYAKAKADSLADLSGRTFRAYNKSTEELAKAAGMVPVQIEASDVPTAFSTGRVQAMITSPATGVDSKAWDFLSYYYTLDAWLSRNMVIVNQARFDALPKPAQDAIAKAAAEAETRGWAMSQQVNASATKTLADNGIKVTAPSPELESGFKKIAETLREKWVKAAGKDGAQMLEAYRK